MAKPDINAQSKSDEFSRIFDEYRAKIDEITRKTERNISKDAPEIEVLPDNKPGKDELIVARVPPQGGKAPVELEWRPDKEAEAIIEKARRQAQKIIEEAEEKSRKEAKKRTQSQEEKIIAKAKKEAEEIVSRAQEAAEKERTDIIAASKSDAEQLIREITERCRLETQQKSSQAISKAQEKAENIMVEAIESSREISRLVTEIIERTKNTVAEFEAGLQAETGELSTLLEGVQKKLEQGAQGAQGPEASAGETPAVTPAEAAREQEDKLTMSLRFSGDKVSNKNGDAPLFKGQVELRSDSETLDYRYLKTLKNHILHIPSVRYLQEYASEKEMSVLFDIREPLPLVDILKESPVVDEVLPEADGFCLVLKNYL